MKFGRTFYKYNYCPACHTRFVIFFPFPSCWVKFITATIWRTVPLLGKVTWLTIKMSSNGIRKAWQLGMHKAETRSRCVRRKNAAKTAGEGTWFARFLTVLFAFECAFPFQHSYAFRHDQLYHVFNVFILKGNIQSLPKILKIHFVHS